MENIVEEILPQIKAFTDYIANSAPLSTAETVKMARAGWSPRGVLSMPGPGRHSKYCLPQDTNNRGQTWLPRILKEFTRHCPENITF